MRSQVIVVFGPGQEYTLAAAGPGWAADAARRWLDEQFVANDCEPLRSSGKVLTADKVMALAMTVGAPRFAGDADWAAEFARATLAALGRPLVRVDVAGGAISY
ncbi:MAG: hypothetical protein KGN16_16815 [Burkholderiales bacterium]|nr:hypothetical protein [Burkholderiales bacterium]